VYGDGKGIFVTGPSGATDALVKFGSGSTVNWTLGRDNTQGNFVLSAGSGVGTANDK
jgi:hypothetical protein